MKNLVGDTGCDKVIRKELEEAGIPHFKGMGVKKAEVPSQIYAGYKGWEFNRAWYYWVAKTTNENSLPFEIADELHNKLGLVVRVSGHGGCPAPREWYKHSWESGVDLYHVDTQEGLNALVKAIDLSADRQEGR
jgi:hypothetical protein